MGLSKRLELERYLQVRLLNIENGFPGVEALVNKCIKVLPKGQLGENSLELSRHAVEFDLVVWVKCPLRQSNFLYTKLIY